MSASVKKLFATLDVGVLGSAATVVFDLPNIPQGLKPRKGYVLARDVQYADKTFPAGTKAIFAGYIVFEMPSTSNDYEIALMRTAAFLIDGEASCRQLSKTDIREEEK